MPPHLHKFKTDLEKIHESLEKKNEMLMNAMMTQATGREALEMKIGNLTRMVL